MPTISVIIPVLHEQELINGLIDQLKGQVASGKWQETDELEIIVVDGDAAGSTISVISDRYVTCITALKGRGNQLSAGATMAKGEIILMLHADTRLPDNWFQAINSAVNAGADWGAFRLGIDLDGFSYRIIERCVDIRCTLFSLPYGDQGIFATREALERIGGIPELPIMEDVELCRRLNASGLSFKLLHARVKTSARRWKKEGVVRRTLKNWFLLLRYLTGTPPEKLYRSY